MISRARAAVALCAAVAAWAAAMPASADGAAASPTRAGPHHGYVRGPWPGGSDPYAYSYTRPAHYPAYNATYWAPRAQMLARSRYRQRLPQYGSSWGYPLDCKLAGYRDCGVPTVNPVGDPRHYYRRDVQAPAPALPTPALPWHRPTTRAPAAAPTPTPD